VAAASDALAGGIAGTDEAQRKSLDEVVGMATEVNPLQRADSAIAWVNLLLEAATAPQPNPRRRSTRSMRNPAIAWNRTSKS